MHKIELLLGIITIFSFVGCGNENSTSNLANHTIPSPPNPTRPQRPTGNICDDVGARLGAARRAHELEVKKCNNTPKACNRERLQQAAGDLAAAQRIFNRCSKM